MLSHLPFPALANIVSINGRTSLGDCGDLFYKVSEQYSRSKVAQSSCSKCHKAKNNKMRFLVDVNVALLPDAHILYRTTTL